MSLRDAEVGHGPNCTGLDASAQRGDLVYRADAAPRCLQRSFHLPRRARSAAEAVSELLREGVISHSFRGRFEPGKKSVIAM